MIVGPVLLAWLLLAAQDAPATPPSHARWTQAVSGSFRSLFTASRSLATHEGYADDLERLRLKVSGSRGDAFSYEIVLDSETHVGSRVGLPDFAAVRRRQDAAWLDLRRVIVDERNMYSDLSLYRGSVSFRSASMTATLGRQRIAWGTARFWSPADLFNPIDPLQVEGDVRQGVDAAQFEWAPVGSRWRTAAVYAPQSASNRAIAAAQLGGTVSGWDIAVFGGRFRRDWVGGVDAAGEWGGAGLRAEMTYTRRGDGEPGKDALRLAVGADYAWSRLYLAGEYFYNQAQPSCQSIAACAAASLGPTAELFTRRRHFISAGASCSVTPLLKAETNLVADLSGSSVFVGPLVRYNAAANVDLAVGGQIFAGGRQGEFHGLARLLFAQVDVHF